MVLSYLRTPILWGSHLNSLYLGPAYFLSLISLHLTDSSRDPHPGSSRPSPAPAPTPSPMFPSPSPTRPWAPRGETLSLLSALQCCRIKSILLPVSGKVTSRVRPRNKARSDQEWLRVRNVTRFRAMCHSGRQRICISPKKRDPKWQGNSQQLMTERTSVTAATRAQEENLGWAGHKPASDFLCSCCDMSQDKPKQRLQGSVTALMLRSYKLD